MADPVDTSRDIGSYAGIRLKPMYQGGSQVVSGRFRACRRIIATMAVAVSAACFTGAAHAQINLGNLDTNRFERGEALNRGRITPHQLHADGVAALQENDYETADANFTELVRREPRNADANFLLGLAKYGAEDWEAARTYLEVASKRDSRRPEAWTRLGLTYIQLGQFDEAGNALAELNKLDTRCRGRCKDDPWIKEGLLLLGPALNLARANAQPQ